MKILQINTTFRNGGSTGRIAYDLMQIQKQEGFDAYVCYGYSISNEELPNTLKIQNTIERKIAILRTRLFDHHGFYNESETRKLIRWMDKIHPDIIHLHNIHNHYVNVKMLFDYIKQHDIPVVWTLHDCWSMTGHCSHFDFAKCYKWKTECHNCTLLKDYPPTWFWDYSTRNYRDKRDCFTGVNNLTIVSPSEWLASIVKQSFLKKYNIHVINNGVDTDVFEPNALKKIDIKEKLGIRGKKMILSLMSVWQKNKGTDYITRLADYLNEDEVLVVVGLQPRQIKQLPLKRCIGISRTNSIEELAAYYSAADVFINPTLQDTFPTTNIEALSCGTPIVTFRTGGSVESVISENAAYSDTGIYKSQYGIVVPQCDFEGFLNAIREVCSNGREFYSSACREKALEKYNKEKQYLKYISLYKEILK